ncbi:hypothetical protein THIAE_05485 [Thiomicrospira aerophila AL3]|uniref:Chemotaxis protein CheZ n=1 Tax=Thiomicrospira aerophila AL3 TaxID=717772 RepID=W0DRS2_9GAMM|nr:hypothetical protein [Thiomicrospira aerophila]AHF01320.1 hypothetical protein THIAE_05485 [Thiomicrospira aerophila AL3]
MSELSPQEKIQTCLDYLDKRLEETSLQTIQIAETILADIRELNLDYSEAAKNNQLAEYLTRLRDTQVNWMHQLQDIILEQTNRDLSGQVIQVLNNFTNKLNEVHLKHLDFDLPSAVASKQANAFEYLSQEEIDLLFSDQNMPSENKDL